jgi:hypothetical protein
VNELPSMEEFEKLVAESFQSDLIPAETSEGSQDSAVEDVASESSVDESTGLAESSLEEEKLVGKRLSVEQTSDVVATHSGNRHD